ncbi:ABC transporter permease [Halanaerobaculum tunisiense]
MSYLWGLASKNLFRNRLRTTISIIAIAFAVMIVVVLRGLIGGMVDSMFQLHIQYNTGHVKVINQDYEQKERLLSLNHPVNGFNESGIDDMQAKLQQVKGVTETIPRLKFGAAVSIEDELVTMMGWGVNPQKEVEFTEVADYITEGRMIKSGAKEILVGTQLLDKLNANVGDKITIVYTTSWGSFKGSTLQVVGVIESGFKLLDEQSFYLSLEQAQRMLALPDQATEILLETRNYRELDRILPRIKQVMTANDQQEIYKLIPWNSGNSIIQYLQIAENIYNLVYVVVILLACVIVVSTMVMIVQERIKEIGMMSALGFKSREILYLFIIEGTLLGIVGSFLGVVSGGIITKILSRVGIDYSAAMADVEAEIIMRPVIYPEFNLTNLVFAFLLGTLIVAVTSIIPARRAAKLNPTGALRSN